MRFRTLVFQAVVAVAVVGAAAADATVTASVVCTASVPPGPGAAGSPACKLYSGVQPGATAVAHYTESVNTTGWADFQSTITDVSASQSLGAFAAGYLEGYLSSQQVRAVGRTRSGLALCEGPSSIQPASLWQRPFKMSMLTSGP